MESYSNEVWKDIPEFEGIYQVSNLGRARSLDRYVWNGNSMFLMKSRILKPCIASGYYEINCYNKNKRKVFLIHRLVAQLFIPNPENKQEVNHKDEDKLNNNVENLEWMTPKENANYGTRNARSIESRRRSGAIKPVLMTDENGNVLKAFSSITEAAVYVNGAKGNIWKCCRDNKYKNNKYKAYGYKWQYK